MTDKELKKLSRLELLELLLTESRENERLREELDKTKKVNTVEKSAQHLNEASQQLESALEQVSSIISNLDRLPHVTVAENTSPNVAVKQNNNGWQMPKEIKRTKTDSGKKSGILGIFSKKKNKSEKRQTAKK